MNSNPLAVKQRSEHRSADVRRSSQRQSLREKPSQALVFALAQLVTNCPEVVPGYMQVGSHHS